MDNNIIKVNLETQVLAVITESKNDMTPEEIGFRLKMPSYQIKEVLNILYKKKLVIPMKTEVIARVRSALK